MNFSDITNYNNTDNYLSILNGIIFIDIIIMLFVFRRIISPMIMYKWYTEYKMYAVLGDVTSIFLVIILTRYIYSLWKRQTNSYGLTYSFGVFLVIAIFAQLCFDTFMYIIIQSIPLGSNQIIDIFRRYTKEGGWFIFTLDCSFTIFSILFASIFNTFTFNTNIIILISFLNMLPFIVFTK
jgi:hypothetical protein